MKPGDSVILIKHDPTNVKFHIEIPIGSIGIIFESQSQYFKDTVFVEFDNGEINHVPIHCLMLNEHKLKLESLIDG